MIETTPAVIGKTPPPLIVSRTAAYNKASTVFYEAFDTIVNVMRTSHNPSDRLGAARTIINKILPDLKATELTGENGTAIRVSIIDYGSQPQHQLATEAEKSD